LASDQKTPLSQADPPAGRAQKTTERSKVARRRAIGVGVAIAAVVGVGAYFLTGGEAPEIIQEIVDSEPDRELSDVAFDLQQVKFEATVAGADKDAQRATAQQAGERITGSMNEMFFVAFVDPDTWGDTGEISDRFTGEAADSLEDDIETLTLGADAGDVYEFVEPGRSTLFVRVLTGPDGEALRASAKLEFMAIAEHTDGTFSRITINGTFFLVPDGNDWKVEAYRAARLEKEIEAPVSPSASVSAPASATETSS
jgi:hypothetical protein